MNSATFALSTPTRVLAHDIVVLGKCEGRSARAQRFTWRADDTPDFGVPAALATPQPVPSGE